MMFKIFLTLTFLISAPVFGQVLVKQNINAGRNLVTFVAAGATVSVTTNEYVMPLTKWQGNFLATSSASSFTCTAGKNFRIQNIVFGTQGNAVATAQATKFSLRYNQTGVVAAGSTVLFQARSATAATAGAYDRNSFFFPDGLDLPCDGILQFGLSTNSTYTTNAPTVDVNITGFEY